MNTNFQKKNYVLIVGSSNMDFNIYSNRLPIPGETVTGGVFKQFLGGKGANQSIAAVRSGSDTIFIGKIGNDSFGDQMVERLEKEGVNTDYIIRDHIHHSGIAFILIDKKGENMITVAPGSNYHLQREELKNFEDIIKNATVLIVQMEIPIETIKYIFEIAKEGNVIKILNPAPLKPISKEIFKNIDIIIPNEGELLKLNELLGFKQFEKIKNFTIALMRKASMNLTRLGIKYIITTIGSKGCLFYDALNDKIIEMPALKVNAIDTVGAGDCFNGVIASQLCQGKNLFNAIKYAICAASIAVTKTGAQDSMPFLNQIKEKVEEYEKKI